MAPQHPARKCRLGIALIAGLLLMISAGGHPRAQSQTTPAPAGQSTQPAQSQPMTSQTAQAPDARATGPAVPSAPAPAAQSPGTGYYWYWVALVIGIVVVLWAVRMWRRRT